MNILSPRHGANQNIAFLGLATALIGVISALAAYVPLSSLFVIIVVPFIAALSVELVEDKYILLFLLASIGISFAIAPLNFQDIIFYVTPAICSGSLYGYLSKKKCPLALVVFASASLSMGLNYLALPIIQGIYGIDMLNSVLTLLNLNTKEGIYDIIPAFFFSYSLAQVGLSYLLIEGVGESLKIERKDDNQYAWIYALVGILLSILSLSLVFVTHLTAYLLLVMAIYFAMFSLLKLIGTPYKFIYIILVCLIIVSIFLFAILYPFYPSRGQLTLLGFFTFSLCFVSFINSLLLKKREKSPIVKEP